MKSFKPITNKPGNLGRLPIISFVQSQIDDWEEIVDQLWCRDWFRFGASGRNSWRRETLGRIKALSTLGCLHHALRAGKFEGKGLGKSAFTTVMFGSPSIAGGMYDKVALYWLPNIELGQHTCGCIASVWICFTDSEPIWLQRCSWLRRKNLWYQPPFSFPVDMQ